MKISALALLSLSGAAAFAPQRSSAPFLNTRQAAVPDTASLLSFTDALHQLPQILLSDEAISGVVDAVAPAVSSAVEAAPEAAEQVAAGSGNGWFGFLAGPIEGLLQIIHSVLVSVGMSEDSWGVSITIMTVLIKLLTYPLTKTQLESTNKMQMLQPTIKELQAKYQSNPDVMNQKIAEVYQTNEVNPLAGCLPAFLQIPIFIGLYRSVLNLAKEDKLNEPYLWLPNLEGPVYGADPSSASDWLFKGWHDGVPSLGWDDTLAFLTIPLILIVSQFISQALMTPKDQPGADQNQVILKILPLMIGWFSLNVPAALGIYWITNNFITTLLTLQIRSTLPKTTVASPTSASASVSMTDMSSTSNWSPVTKREKPTGFGSVANSDDVKPITAIDAEIVEGEDEEGDEVNFDDIIPSAQSSKKRGGKKRGGKKK